MKVQLQLRHDQKEGWVGRTRFLLIKCVTASSSRGNFSVTGIINSWSEDGHCSLQGTNSNSTNNPDTTHCECITDVYPSRMRLSLNSRVTKQRAVDDKYVWVTTSSPVTGMGRVQASNYLPSTRPNGDNFMIKSSISPVNKVNKAKTTDNKMTPAPLKKPKHKQWSTPRCLDTCCMLAGVPGGHGLLRWVMTNKGR